MSKVYSLSEIEAQAKKAVRGAGFAWGYAEEAGKMARFLEAQSLPGLAGLSAYLNQRDQEPERFYKLNGPRYFSQSVNKEQWLCPLYLAADLVDLRGELTDGELALKQVAHPLLLLPALASVSKHLGKSIRMTWPGVDLVCLGSNVLDNTTDIRSLALATTVTLELTVADDNSTEARAPAKLGQVVDDSVWLALDAFAKRTYVPATEASRKGAGPA